MPERRMFVLFMGIILLFPSAVFADSPRKLVTLGNSAYMAGNYDEAIDAYDQASVNLPESARIYFNKGGALYKKEDYKAAAEAFEQAALKSKDLSLEAKAKFNLGNCQYKEAERNMDGDLKKSLETFGKSIRYYQEALELDPTLKEAAENIEITRLVMKSILDEIKKQEEAEKQKQAAADKLKELIERQQALTEQSNDISDRLKKKEADESLLDDISELAEEQNAIQSDTRELADNLEKQQQNPQQQNPLASGHPAGPHLEDAVKAESEAGKRLDDKNVEAALPEQKNAEESLKKALEAMNQDQNKQCNKDGNQKQQGQQQNQQQGQQEQKEQQAQQEQQQQQNQEQMSDQEQNRTQDGKEQQAMAQLPDDAENILDEEKENKQKRNLPAGSGYRRVDRDW